MDFFSRFRSEGVMVNDSHGMILSDTHYAENLRLLVIDNETAERRRSAEESSPQSELLLPSGSYRRKRNLSVCKQTFN